MKKIFLIILILLFTNSSYAVNSVLLCNVDADTSFRPVGYCNIPLMTRINAITLNAGENLVSSSVIDTVNGFLYLGTLTTPGKVIKVRLSDFTRVDAITLEEDEGLLKSAVIDVANGFAYFGTNIGATPAKIVKIDLNTFTRVGRIVFNVGENGAIAAAINTVNGLAYFSVINHLVKVNLLTFTRVSSINHGDVSMTSLVLDTVNGFAYLGGDYKPSVVTKINTTLMTDLGNVSVAPDGNLKTGTIDIAGGYAYFGTGAGSTVTVAKIKKIRLSDFTVNDTLTPSVAELGAISSAIDTINGYIYFGTYTSLGKIFSINLSDFIRKEGISLVSGETYVSTMNIDVANQNIYVGTYSTPSKVVKVGICGD